MIKIRLDVDYAYPSRIKSFIFTTINKQTSSNYLENSKILAKMINESPETVMAYWFFTPHTIPDKELLELLCKERHEVSLHVATQPYLEWKNLEKATGRKVKYYTVHGTQRLIARLMWRRKLSEAKTPIPEGFPLKSFYDFPTLALDWLCYRNPPALAVKFAKQRIERGEIMHIHPEWLFQRGTLNRRGPYYETLKSLLGVDGELEGLQVRKKGFAIVAKYQEEKEYLHDYEPVKPFLKKLTERGVDIFTFVERKWCCPVSNRLSNWVEAEDNVALLKIVPYMDWMSAVGKKTRNMIRKAEKSGVKAEVVPPSNQLAEGICKIYNETPIRQGRPFSHYGVKLEEVKAQVNHAQDSIFIGASFENELVGFVQLVFGDNIVIMAQILSMQRFWDKAVNNALVAKAVEVCASKGAPWLMYGRIGNHPTLDSFKENNGFSKCILRRFYIPVTNKGRLTTKLRLHRELKDALPESLKRPLIPVFNWISRTKTQVRLRLH
jgi:hypothetical protein